MRMPREPQCMPGGPQQPPHYAVRALTLGNATASPRLRDGTCALRRSGFRALDLLR